MLHKCWISGFGLAFSALRASGLGSPSSGAPERRASARSARGTLARQRHGSRATTTKKIFEKIAILANLFR
jgi:hypothetical protein